MSDNQSRYLPEATTLVPLLHVNFGPSSVFARLYGLLLHVCLFISSPLALSSSLSCSCCALFSLASGVRDVNMMDYQQSPVSPSPTSQLPCQRP